MLLLAILLTLVSANVQNVSDVYYSFDTEFYRYFGSKKCDGRSAWRLVRYDTLNIESPYPVSVKGIRALRKSCASSFPIVFFGGVLEINVYVRAKSQNFGVSIEVFDEDDISVYCYVYGRSSEGFVLGWRTISLQIDKYTKGYIQLRGISFGNDIVVIDSFRYKPSNTNIHDVKKIKRSVNYGKEYETENIIIYNKGVIQDEGETDKGAAEVNRIKSSGVRGNEGSLDYQREIANESHEETQEEKNSSWNPFFIFFVTFASVIAVLFISVGAYHCGKIRAIEKSVPPIVFEDLVPVRTITIPRVTRTLEI